MKYKEGKDFEWVPMKDKDGKVVKDGRGKAVKTRRFFTKAEKEAMKSGDKPKAETKPKPKSKPKSSSSAPTSSKRPQARRTEGPLRSSSGGRPRYTPTEFTNDGGPRRGSRKPRPNTAKKDTGTDNNRIIRENFSDVKGGRGDGFKEVTGRKVEQSFVYDGKQYDRTGFLAKFKAATDEDKRKMWEKLTPGQRRNLNLPVKNLSFSPKGPRTSNMAKGGMVKSGNKDYKKSGMFYKSGSPRGYK